MKIHQTNVIVRWDPTITNCFVHNNIEQMNEFEYQRLFDGLALSRAQCIQLYTLTRRVMCLGLFSMLNSCN